MSQTKETIETLAVRIEAIKEADKERDLRYQQRFEAQEKAIGKYEDATKEWKLNANEFRGQLTDQAGTFVRNDKFEASANALRERIDAEVRAIDNRMSEIMKRLDLGAGQTEGSASTWKLIAALLGTLLVLTGIYSFVVGFKSTPQPVIGVDPPVRVAPVTQP